MQKLAASTLAILFGVAWTVVPAIAQTSTDKPTTGEKVEQKMERAGEKMQEKADRVGEKLEKKTEPKAEGAGDKAESKTEKIKDKAESAMDKVKTKAREAKEKIKEKVTRADDRSQTDVRAAQQALRDKGHDPGPIDGVMGPRTSAAVSAFQKAEGLKETGRLDAATMEKLGARASAASPRTEPTPETPRLPPSN